jgi:hypothetical protein
MPDWRRVVLALTVLIMLIPVVAVAAPEALPDYLTPWMNETDQRISALEAAVADLEAGLETLPTSVSPSEPPNVTSTAGDGVDTTKSTLTTELSNTDDSAATTAATTTTTAATTTTTAASTTTSSATATSKAPTTTAGAAVTTTTEPASTPTTKPPASATGGKLTGKVCGEIKSDAKLVGDISLCGDLTITGSGTTLYARPGVNVQGNGHQIVFMNGARADWQGTKVFTWSGNGSNANLGRDINFTNLRRIMFMKGAGPSTLKYFTISDSGGSSLDEYPLHWHLNGNSTRGTLVEGVVVVNGKNHAFVPHGSNGITFRDTIAKNIRGDAYWWNLPGSNNCSTKGRFCTTDNSNDILYDHALVNGVTNGPGDSRGHTLTGFLLGAGSGNVIRNSSAINIHPSKTKNCSGFHWPSQANLNEGGNVWVFNNNHGTSDCDGIFVWQNGPNHHVINGFTGGGIEHGAYVNNYEYRNVKVPYLYVHALGWKIVNSSVGDVTVFRHNVAGGPVVFDNVKIKSFTIDNATNGTTPGTYELKNTGLSCGDIVYKSVVKGTKVIINGSEC